MWIFFSIKKSLKEEVFNFKKMNFYFKSSSLPQILEARQRKTKRLKQAKEEAVKLVANLSKERADEFNEFEKNYLMSSDDVVRKISEETEARLQQMENEYNERKDAVIKELLHSVLEDIQPKLHKNLRLESL